MANTSEARALPFFTDLQGQPLASGSIYIGQPGLDPIAYPVVVTSDVAGTTVVSQPVRTTNGHATAAGALIHLFCPIPYSITILDSAGRPVYISLNETDPVALAIGSSSVQSSSSLADLRARSGSATNQVWVTGYGLYVFNPTDTTSPESIPTLIVGNDGSRYNLSKQYVNGGWVHANENVTANNYGAWLHWDTTTGTTNLSNNLGGGTGGFRIRTVDPTGVTETGITTISKIGDISTNGNINTPENVTAGGNVVATGNVQATGNLISAAGGLTLNAGNTRGLSYNAGTDQYSLASAPLLINGSVAIRLLDLTANGVGAYGLGNTTSPQPSLPGTWLQTGTAQGGVVLWIRVA